MTINLEHVRNVVELFLHDMAGRGVKFRDGTREALITAGVWAGSDTRKFVDAIDNEFKKWVIPEGLMMPWGKIVPIKAKRA